MMPFINATSVNAKVVHRNGTIRYQEVPTNWIVSHRRGGVVIAFVTPDGKDPVALADLLHYFTRNADYCIYSNDNEMFLVTKEEFQKYLDL